MHCLAGENGAGKSTLIKILTGAIQRDEGDYSDRAAATSATRRPSQAREAGVGVVYQELSLLPDLSVGENLMMGRLPRPPRDHPAGRAAQARATTMLERVGLDWLDPRTPVEETAAGRPPARRDRQGARRPTRAC